MPNVSCTVALPVLNNNSEPTELKVKSSKRARVPVLSTEDSLKNEILNTKAQNSLVSALKKTKVEQAELKILKNLPSIVQRVIDQALEGDNQAQKLLLDRVLPVLKQAENENSGGNKAGFNISINVSGNSEVAVLGKSEPKQDESILEGEIVDG